MDNEMGKPDLFYELDADSDDFKHMLDADLYPAISEIMKTQTPLLIDWNLLSKNMPGVIIHDRLMTDAALGTRPIKTEHSYSLVSNGESISDSLVITQNLDTDEDYLDAFNSNNNLHGKSPKHVSIKEEPISETSSPNSSYPSSPQSCVMYTSDLHFDAEESQPASTIEEDQFIIKMEPPSRVFNLPPTPPSCGSDDGEEQTVNVDNAEPCSKNVDRINPSSAFCLYGNVRQPICTPLISSQPKGSSGALMLTEEEKRTLIAEGYSVPTKLPLTKAEEKSLKKIRRKIKNKISAQESRRKKKEYMDQLERKVECLLSENCNYKKKIEKLENSNVNLLQQLHKLQATITRTHPQLTKNLK